MVGAAIGQQDVRRERERAKRKRGRGRHVARMFPTCGRPFCEAWMFLCSPYLASITGNARTRLLKTSDLSFMQSFWPVTEE